MLRDVFYYGKKPNVHPREQFAKNLEDARSKSTTVDFWIINEFCDYTNFDWDFDFEFLPDEDVWAQDHNNVWPSQHQKDSGTWLCSKNISEVTIYRNDVSPIKRKKELSDNWIVHYRIDEHKFDFSWHPDPSSPPFIYVWGNQWISGKVTPTVEYKVPGATEIKHMDNVAFVLSDMKKWDILEPVDLHTFDFSWMPDPTAPPYIYVWGNQWNKAEDKITLQYKVEGATEYKYMSGKIKRLPDTKNWFIPENIDVSNFDFSWEPSPADNPYIYQFGTQWQNDGGPRYITPGASEIKYIDIQKAVALPTSKNWEIPKHIDVSDFDFSWHPDSVSPKYIYKFGTQWALTGGPKYVMEGATEVKYMDNPIAKALPNLENWVVPANVDASSFDFSWHPYIDDQPYIYVFGTQHQKTGGPKYMTPGTNSGSPVKYIDRRILKSKRLPNKNKFAVLNNLKIKDFDWSWHPDDTSEPYIYIFGNNLYPGEEMPTIEYRMQGATQIKYVNDIVATLAPDKTNWEIPDDIDDSDFDYSWKPHPQAPPYIYEFATQWQKTGGPRYVVPDATEVNYISAYKVKRKSIISKEWQIPPNIDITEFDFSWHPDATSPKYIYQFGTQWAMTGGPRYVVEGATEIKYMEQPLVKALPNRENWVVPADVDAESFDFSWHPYVEDKPYIYVFGTQHQKTGGPKYMTPGVDGTSATKYIDRRILQAKRLPNKKRFAILNNYKIKDFDWSWHPDDTAEPYIYVFGNTQYPAEIMPTIEYRMPGAKQVKYINDIKAELAPDLKNWQIPEYLDCENFDFSWKPNPTEPPYIYVFGTQWQKTGGPKYVVQGATEVKYVDTQKAISISYVRDNWSVPDNIDMNSFDFSWHPDDSEEPYTYEFATQHQPNGGPRYTVKNAIETKYVDTIKATALPIFDNWVLPEDLDGEKFDFSWHPDNTEKPYTYIFGNQHYPGQIDPTVKYIVPGATEVKYVENIIAFIVPNKKNYSILHPIKEESFDFSWRPSPKDPPYIYVWGNQWHDAVKMPTVLYTVEGATEYKYMSDKVATLISDKTNWVVPKNIDDTNFDYSWVPDPNDPPYTYEFGTQWQKTGGPKYIVKDSTDIKYIDVQKVRALPRPNDVRWEVPEDLKIDDVEFFSWHPDSTEKSYIYQFGTQWALTGGPKFVMPNAKELKFIDNPLAKTARDMTHWVIPDDIDIEQFDFTWHPYGDDQPYVYQFGTQHQKTGGPKYITKGTSINGPVKYVDRRILKAIKLPSKDKFTIEHGVLVESFDYSWHPDDTEDPYNYIFGNDQYSAEKMPTVKYLMKGATQDKFINEVKAKLNVNYSNWEIPNNIDIDSFDFSWIPDPGDDPYIYEFATVWNDRGGPKYIVPNATQYKYITNIKAKLKPSKDNWQIPDNIDLNSFDLSWVPHPDAPPYIYEFATVWNNRGGPKYFVSGATEYKYIEDIKAQTLSSKTNWEIPTGINVGNFDFSWVPHPESPPYVYQFGTLENDNDGPRYITPNNSGEIVRLLRVNKEVESTVDVPQYYIETTLEDLIDQHKNEIFWALNKNIDYTNFDFNWRPSIEQARYVQVFGSPDSQITQTYFVSAKMYKQGYKDFNFIQSEQKADTEYLATLFKLNDMFFVDRGNIESKERFEKLKQKYPNIQKTRFLNTWVDTINRCINRANTQLCWILNSELDYTDFNFNYFPNPWQMKMVHVFGTQWSHWGTTFLVNRESFPEDTKYIKIVEHLSCLNFVKDRKAIATNNLYDIVLINHGTKDIERVKKQLEYKANGCNIKIVDYVDSYLNTIKNIVKDIYTKKEHYLWICSSVCEYANFDLSYICDPFAKDHLHVFPSGKQKFGDTFLIDVNKTKEIIDTLENLEDYFKVNYNQSQRLTRLPAPIVNVSEDTQVNIKDYEFDFPYAIFQTEDLTTQDIEPMVLWTEQTKTIMVTSTGASRIVAPKEIKNYVKEQLYDYPYIKTASKLIDSKPLDIIYLSNGEKCAEANYEHLLAVTKGLKNRIVRVDGVNGRVEAYHAALEASQTPWAFTVFAKLKVNTKFDFNWQPDRLQIPKHYIFHAKNPLNGLEYGHQGMIAYNKKLTLANTGKGLDFTLDDPHETVKLLSGTATFNTDAYSTWRTAFREVIKLKSDYTDISQDRLKIWLTVSKGKFAEDCIRGANDAVEYYNDVSGDIEQLRLSYEWSWLKKYYNKKYK